jgi:RND family efflux transporter MFP subunit
VEAYLEPYRSIEISSVESGKIAEILVSEGERVSKGQELIRLDTAVLQSQLKVAEAQAAGKGRVMAAQADYDLRQDKLEKLEALAARGKATNEAELDRERAAVRSSEGLLLAAQEEMEIYKLSAERIGAEIERHVLRSSIDGVVVEIVKDVAEQVSMMRSQPGEPTYLIRVVRLEELKMIAHLPYRIALQLQVGDRLPVLTEGPRGSGEVRVEGVVEFVSPIIKSSTATMAVRLRIDNSDLRLRSGAAARVLVEFAK